MLFLAILNLGFFLNRELAAIPETVFCPGSFFLEVIQFSKIVSFFKCLMSKVSNNK